VSDRRPAQPPIEGRGRFRALTEEWTRDDCWECGTPVPTSLEAGGKEYAICPMCGTRLVRPADGQSDWRKSEYVPRARRPPAVRFAIGARPGLSKGQANALAGLLEVERNITASRLAARIRWTIALNGDRPPPPRADVELHREELAQIAAIFETGPALLEVRAYARLNLEVNVELTRHERW
jgi:hypothetical protein